VLGLIAVLGMIVEQPAFAQKVYAPPDVVVDFGSLAIPRDPPVGSIYERSIGQPWGATGSPSCTVTRTGTVNNGTAIPINRNVYATPMGNVGVILQYTSGINGPYTHSTTENFDLSSNPNYGMYRRIAFYVYGPVGKGPATAVMPSLTITWSGSCIPTVTSTISASGDVVLTQATCTVLTSSVDVVLPKISTSALPAVNSTAGATPFSIGLDCGAIGSGKLYVTLTDQTTPGNRSNLLALTPASTATGVQVQVLNGGTAISYGPDSAAAKNTNQILLAASGGLSKVNLTAQYVRTGALTPGTIGGVATFTMSYQ